MLPPTGCLAVALDRKMCGRWVPEKTSKMMSSICYVISLQIRSQQAIGKQETSSFSFLTKIKLTVEVIHGLNQFELSQTIIVW